MEEISIERSGIANLDFTGELIGQGGNPTVTIKIYRTTAGKYVAQTNANVKYGMAEHFENPTDVINWFKKGYGGITTAVEDAIEGATKHDEAFKAIWNQHVD